MGDGSKRRSRQNDRGGRKLFKAIQDNTAELKKQRQRSRRVAEKAIDDTHSADVDMHERRMPTVWVRPDEGVWAETPPPGEMKHATEESLPVEEAKKYG